jgi:hypothetical protein
MQVLAGIFCKKDINNRQRGFIVKLTVPNSVLHCKAATDTQDKKFSPG